MRKEISRFKAVSPDGNVYTIIESQDVFRADTMDDPSAPVEGLKSFRLDSGRAVNFVDENTFRTTSGVVLKRE